MNNMFIYLVYLEPSQEFEGFFHVKIFVHFFTKSLTMDAISYMVSYTSN